MDNFEMYNPNPRNRRVGDCVVRAISKALGQSWDETFAGVCLKAFELSDMPSANNVWGAYLRDKGFTRRILPDDCVECYTVENFSRDHPYGTYILAIAGHVVCVQDGVIYDTWDSRGEVPIYYWEHISQKEAE